DRNVTGVQTCALPISFQHHLLYSHRDDTFLQVYDMLSLFHLLKLLCQLQVPHSNLVYSRFVTLPATQSVIIIASFATHTQMSRYILKNVAYRISYSGIGCYNNYKNIYSISSLHL